MAIRYMVVQEAGREVLVMMRKISIVIAETDVQAGESFNVYLEGDTERLGIIGLEEMSPAEFWASRFFKMCSEELHKTGAMQEAPMERKDFH